MQNPLAVCPGFFIGANEMTAVAFSFTAGVSIWTQKHIADPLRAAGLPIRESFDYRESWLQHNRNHEPATATAKSVRVPQSLAHRLRRAGCAAGERHGPLAA